MQDISAKMAKNNPTSMLPLEPVAVSTDNIVTPNNCQEVPSPQVSDARLVYPGFTNGMDMLGGSISKPPQQIKAFISSNKAHPWKSNSSAGHNGIGLQFGTLSKQ